MQKHGAREQRWQPLVPIDPMRIPYYVVLTNGHCQEQQSSRLQHLLYLSYAFQVTIRVNCIPVAPKASMVDGTYAHSKIEFRLHKMLAQLEHIWCMQCEVKCEGRFTQGGDATIECIHTCQTTYLVMPTPHNSHTMSATHIDIDNR